MPSSRKSSIELFNRYLKPILLPCLTVLFSLFLIFQVCLQPGFSQTSNLPAAETTSTPADAVSADVVIDGRVLFRLGSIDGFTGERRANSANADLQRALRTTPLTSPIKVEAVTRNELTTIRVNNRHLLTVTGGDFMVGVLPEEQAEEWVETLQETLARAQAERLPGHARATNVKIFVALAGALLLSVLVRWWHRKLRRQRFKKSRRSQPVSYVQTLLPPVLTGVQVGIWLLFLAYVCELLPGARMARYGVFKFLERTFDSALWMVGEQNYSVLDLLKLGVLLVLLWVGVRGLTAVIKSSFLQATIPERGAQDAIATLIQFMLMAIGTFVLLQVWGIDLSALAILASVLGVGLGFGLQNVANNFISGWILLVERPVQVGDFVKLGEVVGTVERIGARSTELRTPDRISIIVPNSDLIQNQVMNWSYGHPVSRFHISLGVAYGSNVGQVHAAAMEAVSAHPEVLRYPQPRMRFLAFGDSSLDFDLMAWTRDPLRQIDIKSDVHYLLEANLRRYHIEIPFPQRDINVRTTQLQQLLHDSNANGAANGAANGSSFSTAPTQPPRPAGRDERTHVINDIVDEPVSAGVPIGIMTDLMHYSSILQTPKNTTTHEIDRLVEQMRGPEGLAIKDRRFRLTIYPNCFVGSEAVAWISKTQKATHEEAIRLGELLVERGIIHHVTDEHSFKDEHLFYRFYETETSGYD